MYAAFLTGHYYADIDSLGRFDFTFENLSAQDMFLTFNNKWQRLFAVPRDSLMVYFDATQYKQDIGTHFMGSYSDICYDLANYRIPYQATLPTNQQQQSKKMHLEPDAYKRYRKEFLQQERDFLINYCAENNCSEGFKKWFDKNAEYTYYRELMKYPMAVINTLEEYKEKFYPYEEYYSFMDSIPLEHPDATICTRFGQLVHAIGNMKLGRAGINDQEFWRQRQEKIVLDVLSS